jgi:homoserine kinase
VNEITIRVPGTSANFGPGYDCLGIALALYNRITVRRGGPAQNHVMASDAAARFFAAAHVPPFAFHFEIRGEVPEARGLGSSVTVRLGILSGLNELCGRPLDREKIFALCAQLEGHPDNAAPACFGGFTIAKLEGPPARCEVDANLRFVLLVPDFEISTPAARAVLPAEIAHREAVDSLANACRITAAFCLREYELLRGSFRDRLHQPYREPLMPMLPQVIAAGEKAGALGGFLSGSGSTICCVTLSSPERVAEAMLSAGTKGARTIMTSADNEGCRVVSDQESR